MRWLQRNYCFVLFTAILLTGDSQQLLNCSLNFALVSFFSQLYRIRIQIKQLKATLSSPYAYLLCFFSIFSSCMRQVLIFRCQVIDSAYDYLFKIEPTRHALFKRERPTVRSIHGLPSPSLQNFSMDCKNFRPQCLKKSSRLRNVQTKVWNRLVLSLRLRRRINFSSCEVLNFDPVLQLQSWKRGMMGSTTDPLCLSSMMQVRP